MNTTPKSEIEKGDIKMVEIGDYARSLSEDIVYDVCHNEAVKTPADVEFVLSKLITLLADELNSWIWDINIIERERKEG